jgi:hypothetical protein
MSLTKPYNKLLMVIPEAYFLYKGFYQNVEVRIVGEVGTFDNRYTRLKVKLYWQGLEMGWCTRSGGRPFGTVATARKHAKEYAASTAKFAATGRAKNWPERSGYDAHVSDHRNLMLETYRDEPAVYEYHLRRTAHLREPCPIAA